MSLFLPVIDAFNKAGVEYVIVGGLAVILHGHVRLTTDLDAVIHLTETNAGKAMGVLQGLGFKPRAPVPASDFADPSKRAEWIREKNMKVFSFYSEKDPLFDVDIFVNHPRNFDELYAQSVIKELGSIAVRVVGLDHLIQMKEEAGRPKDLEDARVLKMIKNG
jgi:hypothetical protein